MTGLEQIGIGVFGVAAIWLSQDSRERVRRWSCIAGLLAQPFWFYTTAVNGQWGIFALSFFYTWSWWKGVRTYWWKKKPVLATCTKSQTASVVLELGKLTNHSQGPMRRPQAPTCAHPFCEPPECCGNPPPRR